MANVPLKKVANITLYTTKCSKVAIASQNEEVFDPAVPYVSYFTVIRYHITKIHLFGEICDTPFIFCCQL